MTRGRRVTRTAQLSQSYNVAAANSIPAQIAERARRRMYQAFVQNLNVGRMDTILDVGATADQGYRYSNYLEKWHPWPERITAVGTMDLAPLTREIPAVRVVRASGLALPFADRSYDFVHASAVLEHVGSTENQFNFLAECARCADCGIFLTTPYRWHPIEFHTLLPFLHWFPRRMHRRWLRLLGHDFFASEENLNLLDRRDLQRLTARLEGFRWQLSLLRTYLLPTNVLVVAFRTGRD